MKYLYVDAGYSLTVGLLDSQFNWIDIKKTETYPSQVLHKNIHDILKLNNEILTSLKGVFFCKGPGSYTGLRLIEGLEQYLKFEGINCYDFYSFDLIKILNLNDPFLYSAYKNQFLLVEKDMKLIKREEIPDRSFYINTNNIKNLAISKFTLIEQCIEERSNLIFENVFRNNESKEIYYFRPLAEEFGK